MKVTCISLAMLLLLARSAGAIPITSTLDIHYDGTNVSTSGANVTSWNNQGLLGTAGNATPPATSPTLVVGVLNGQNVIDFAGTPTSLQTASFASDMAQPNHVFFVLKSDADSGPVVFDGVTGTERHFFQTTIGGGGHIYAGASHFGGAGLTTGSYRIFSLIYNGASSRVDVNAALFFTPGDIGVQPMGGISLGNSPVLGSVPAYQLDGQFAEVAVFNTNLNSAEQKIVENYLSAKYNVGSTVVAVVNNTLGTTNDHYAGDLASNLNYDFDVFGIGRVNVSNQLATSENNAGLQITGDASLENGEWVLAGHKTSTNSINPDGSWARVWYVDKSLGIGNTDGVNATLTFDYSSAGLIPPSLSGQWTQINLLYSPTDPFSFGSLGIAGAVSGDQISFFVPDGQLLDGYFTLQVLTVPEPSTLALFGLGVVGLAANARRRRRKAA